MKGEEIKSLDLCVTKTIEKVGKDIRLGIPLGLGKPNLLVNAFYQRAKRDSSISLKIFTALTLEKPKGKSFLEKRFLGPFVKRVFGNYPDLDYEIDRVSGNLPKNVELLEFYFPAGKMLENSYAQRNYISCNYTHVARDMISHGINVLAQMVAKHPEGKKLSLSCNPDVTLDLVPMMLLKEKEEGNPVVAIADINENLPYMYGNSEVDFSFFDFIIDNPDHSYTLFGPPKLSVSTQDHMIGFYASTLIKDGGCLQIGIGSLGDAIVHSLIMRQQNNSAYRQFLDDLNYDVKFLNKIGGSDTFSEGLFGASEMLVDGFINLFEAKILKKEVYDHPALQELLNEKLISKRVNPDMIKRLLSVNAIHSVPTHKDFYFLQEFGIIKKTISFKEEGPWCLENGEEISINLTDKLSFKNFAENCLGEELQNGKILHAGFFLGNQEFYKKLNSMTPEMRAKIDMRSVGEINQLYWSEEIDTLQRQNARFVNTCLMVTLSGAVVSDGLENGKVISGVGGQYNFVAMAHAIDNGRSIIKCRSTRQQNGEIFSNIVFNYGHITIPRHLRDIVVTEYGIADLRGKTDSQVAKALINIADSRFQNELLVKAKESGKIERDYSIPYEFSKNFPENLERKILPFKEKGFFKMFPFGTDFSELELEIAKALKQLKRDSVSKKRLLKIIFESSFLTWQVIDTDK